MQNSTDIIGAAQFGYQTVWQERAYLLRLGAAPFAIVLINHILTLRFGTPGAFVQQGLFLLPAFFAKGWFLAQFLRTLLAGERWPFRPEGRNGKLINLEQLLTRARGLLASMIAFVVMSMALWLLIGSFLGAAVEANQQGKIPQESETVMFLPALAILLMMLYAVRYIWLYIPVSILIPPAYFLRQIGGFMTSVRLCAVALICTMPPMMLGGMIGSLLLGGNPDLTKADPIALAILVLLDQFLQMTVWALCTAAITFQLRDNLPRVTTASE